jgi:hypothetical protein
MDLPPLMDPLPTVKLEILGFPGGGKNLQIIACIVAGNLL